MTNLDARYGRAPAQRRKQMLIGVGFAAVFTIVLVAWVVWGGLGSGQGDFETRNVGHSVVDDSHVAVDFEISVAPGTPMRCAVQALDLTHSTIGWKLVDIDASETRTTAHRVTVVTTQPPANGLVYRCWVA